jgi:hypothetical protein
MPIEAGEMQLHALAAVSIGTRVTRLGEFFFQWLIVSFGLFF